MREGGGQKPLGERFLYLHLLISTGSSLIRPGGPSAAAKGGGQTLPTLPKSPHPQKPASGQDANADLYSKGSNNNARERVINNPQNTLHRPIHTSARRPCRKEGGKGEAT